MISATRRWLRRNRNNFAIGVGVLGVGYIAGQYVLSKVSEAKERMTNDRIAKEKCVKLPEAINLSPDANTTQLAPSLSTKPRGLYLYRPRSTPYCNR